MSTAQRDLNELLHDILGGCAKWVLGLGATAALFSAGFLFYTVFAMGDATAAAQTAEAIRNVTMLQKVLLVGLIGAAVGSAYLFWSEELLGAGQLLIAGILFFAPLYMPMVAPAADGNDAARKALGVLQEGGTWLGVIAIALLVIDVSNRVRNRATVGVKADKLQYGKGIKEEPDRQNVFLGKCWQLPFCRKFVRERCPIYHSNRTCWKEQVGCMCEEQVIKGAMENKVIPKDAVLAAAMIPRNARLTPQQKFERCKNCVIYNEHQRHKYKALLPGILIGFVVFYVLLRLPMIEGATRMIAAINRTVQGLSYGTAQSATIPPAFVEMLVFLFCLVGLSYALKVLEYAIFKLKI